MIKFFEIFDTKTEVNIVMELMKMELDAFKKISGKVGERNLRIIGYSTFKALDFLFMQSVIHRDIKPKNILVSENGQIKLADFGLACTKYGEKLTTYSGTFLFTSPEMRKIHSPLNVPEEVKASYDERTDLFSLGLTLYNLMCDEALPMKICYGEKTFKTTCEGKCLQQLKFQDETNDDVKIHHNEVFSNSSKMASVNKFKLLVEEKFSKHALLTS